MSLFARNAAQLARSALTKSPLTKSAFKGPIARKALNAVTEVVTEVVKGVVDGEVKAVLKGGKGVLSAAVEVVDNKPLSANMHSASKLESVVDKKAEIDVFEKANDMRATMHNTMPRGSTPIVMPRQQIEKILGGKNDVQGR